MSKLSDALRAINVINDHDILMRFGGPKDVVVYYTPAQPRMVRPSGSHVYSPRFDTDPKGHFSDYGKKFFSGKRAESMPKALAWASERYGITEWVTSPCLGGKIPKRVLDAAKKAVADARKAGTPASPISPTKDVDDVPF